jgi:HTH-type transcriptional regulator, sugar sensing transcriptional regulator
MELVQIFEDLGLNAKEGRTYLAILQLGRSSIGAISDQAGVKRTSIYNFIDKLLQLVIVSKTVIKGRSYYEANHPEKLLALQKERTKRLEGSLPELSGLFNLVGTKPRISYFEGPAQVKNIVREEPNCKREALYIWPGKPILEMIGGAEFMASIDRARIARGVRIRTIRFPRTDVPYKTSAHGEKFLRELRFAPPSISMTMGLGIYDSGKVGFFSSAKEGFGILIESQELMSMMRQLYSCLWERCLPARAGDG